MTSLVLPRDVFDEIFSQLKYEQFGRLKYETSTLKSCSLVCRSFRRNAQKMLFNFIDIVLGSYPDSDDDDIENCAGPSINLVLIVKNAPHLIEYIQELRISGLLIHYLPHFNRKYTDLADALGIFSRKGEFPINLRSLSLQDLPWFKIFPRLEQALVLLMSAYSLRDIDLDRVMRYPAGRVQNLPPLLKSLSLKNTTFSSLPTTLKELPKLESLTIRHYDPLEALVGTDRGLDGFPDDAVERIVNTTQLKTFEGAFCSPYTMPVFEQILRPASNSLEHLTLQFNITDPDSVSIDLNQFPHLNDITIHHYCDVSPTLSPTVTLITRTMKKISHRNVIQNLSFYLSLMEMHMFDFESAMKDLWQELDMICFIPQLALSKSFRGITFIIESSAFASGAFSDLVQNKLAETKKANKLHIETVHFRSSRLR